jgi:hypothetical protein
VGPGGDDARAELAEGERRAKPDAARPAGDEHGLAGEKPRRESLDDARHV